MVIFKPKDCITVYTCCVRENSVTFEVEGSNFTQNNHVTA